MIYFSTFWMIATKELKHFRRGISAHLNGTGHYFETFD